MNPVLATASMGSDDPLSYSDPELVIALVYPTGTDSDRLRRNITRSLGRFRYGTDPIRISELIEMRCGGTIPGKPLSDRIDALIREGNQLCQRQPLPSEGSRTREDVLAFAAITEIAYRRPKLGTTTGHARPKIAHVISSLKRPDECDALRRVYGPGLFVIGASTPVPNRVSGLMHFGASRRRAEGLVSRDSEEATAGGQKLQKTMQMADAFVSLGTGVEGKEIDRVFDLIFGAPFVTPVLDEYAMFLAFSASLRSASLSRQVGAALLDANGELVGVGCNDVPKFGGGLYRHIIASGVRRVVYVEPYPKSRARELHPDAVWSTEFQGTPTRTLGKGRVMFEPFVGIGPRRFFDLFSVSHGSGTPLRRKAKDDLHKMKWQRTSASVRCPMRPSSYLELEEAAVKRFKGIQDRSRRTS